MQICNFYNKISLDILIKTKISNFKIGSLINFSRMNKLKRKHFSPLKRIKIIFKKIKKREENTYFVSSP